MDAVWSLLIHGLFMDGIADFLQTLKPVSPELTLLVLIFILLTNFTVLNMLIGIICEAILSVKEEHKSNLDLLYLEMNLRDMLVCYDRDNSRSLGQMELVSLMHNPETVTCISNFGVDIELLKEVLHLQFEVVRGKTNTEPQLSFNDMLATVKRLRGGNAVTITDFTELRCYTCERFDDIQTTLRAVCDHLHITAT